MTADAWDNFDVFPLNLGNKVIDMDGDTFKLQLHTSTYSLDLAGDEVKADLSNELANGNGYTTGGATLSSLSWSEAAGTVTWDCADPTWTASGATLTFRTGIIVDDTPTSPADPLCWATTFDNSPADIAVLNTQVFTVTINASGVFTLS